MSDPGKWGDLLPRLISGAAMAAVGLAMIWLGGPWFAALATVAGGLMIWELAAMTDRSRTDEAVMVGAAAAIILGVIFWTRDPYLAPMLLLPAAYGIVRPKRPMRAIFAVYAALIMVACYGLVAFRESYGLLWLLWLILVVVVTEPSPAGSPRRSSARCSCGSPRPEWTSSGSPHFSPSPRSSATSPKAPSSGGRE